MKVEDIPINELHEAPWNANRMEPAMLARLKESLKRYGMIENLVVRGIDGGCYEVLAGNQRLGALRELGFDRVACVVVDLDDADARLLAQALNRIQGEDDLGLKADLMKKVLEKIPGRDVMAVIPETAITLQSLSSLGAQNMAAYLENWERDRAARLKHLQFQLTSQQLEIVEEALGKMLAQAKEMKGGGPNVRGTALYLICNKSLGREDHGRRRAKMPSLR